MARLALIKGGKIEGVIIAPPDFVARADPRWLAQYDEIREAPADAEPGATIAPDGKVTRAARAAEPKTTDERIADLEAAVAAKVVR